MITVENVSKQYGSNSVLQGISVHLHEGAIYGLVGANGCGKTTLMRCICGFSQPTSGYVVVNGCLIGGKSALRRNPELAKADAGIISRVSDFAPSTGVIIETPASCRTKRVCRTSCSLRRCPAGRTGSGPGAP